MVTRHDLASSKNIFDLVSVEAQVVTSVREASQDEYVLAADGEMFSAIYRHPKTDSAHLPPMKEMPPGSRVRVSGICILDGANPYDGDVPFDVLMRSPDDIAVIAPPSLLNIRTSLCWSVCCSLLSSQWALAAGLSRAGFAVRLRMWRTLSDGAGAFSKTSTDRALWLRSLSRSLN